MSVMGPLGKANVSPETQKFCIPDAPPADPEGIQPKAPTSFNVRRQHRRPQISDFKTVARPETTLLKPCSVGNKRFCPAYKNRSADPSPSTLADNKKVTQPTP